MTYSEDEKVGEIRFTTEMRKKSGMGGFSEDVIWSDGHVVSPGGE